MELKSFQELALLLDYPGGPQGFALAKFKLAAVQPPSRGGGVLRNPLKRSLALALNPPNIKSPHVKPADGANQEKAVGLQVYKTIID